MPHRPLPPVSPPAAVVAVLLREPLPSGQGDRYSASQPLDYVSACAYCRVLRESLPPEVGVVLVAAPRSFAARCQAQGIGRFRLRPALDCGPPAVHDSHEALTAPASSPAGVPALPAHQVTLRRLLRGAWRLLRWFFCGGCLWHATARRSAANCRLESTEKR